MPSDLVLFDPDLVIARIAELNTAATVFRAVAGAADLIAAMDDMKQSPAAYVVPVTDDATPNSLASMAVAQRVTARFGVVIGEKNLRDARGQAANKGLRVLRLAVGGQLHGWRPSDDYDVLEYAGGRLLRMDVEHQVLWWQDNYRTVTDWRTT